jgi:hypothetical protein
VQCRLKEYAERLKALADEGLNKAKVSQYHQWMRFDKQQRSTKGGD